MSDNRYYVNCAEPSAAPCRRARYNAIRMSVVEDMRKVLQDFLAPELRAVDAKFGAVGARFDAVDQTLDAMTKILEARHQELMVRIDATHQRIEVTNDRIDNLKTSLDLDKRVERLETGHSHRSA
jgi:hypothetical protein